ncbi:MAG: hypothetical protein KL863_08740 [Rhizobium sp.]|nr:hypothetical protein [Rhizobium sp.]
MVNGGEIFVCMIAGLAIPLAMLDGLKALARGRVPHQQAGLHLEQRPLVWLLAILLGPGLFADRMLADWREGLLSVADRVNALVITLGWATIYGYVVLGLSRAIVPS